ncbi:MAG: histidine phosphatase family protein [Myxococcales bacterium]|nr:histidine phosphatase family protein [Myxococcales bacterium]
MATAPTELLLVRHGEADSNRDGRFGGWSPVPLTDRGRRQAVAAAAELRDRRPTAVITSDVVRAVQTAEPIARELRVTPRLEPGLRERSLGVFDGLAFTEAEARFPELWRRLIARDPDAVPDGGETAAGVFARVSAAIARICADHAGERVVVVSHGLALFHAFSYVCGLGVPNRDASVFVLVDNASITHVEHRVGDRWRIITLNDTAHLRGLE